MKDISDTLEYKGKEYKIAFDFNVMQDLQEEYGTFNNWIEAAYGKETGEPSIKALAFVVMSMVNNGIDEANEEKGVETEKPITIKTANRMLSEFIKNSGGLSGVVEKIDGLMTKSLQGGENSKNE